MRTCIHDPTGVLVVRVEGGAAVFELLHEAVGAVVQDHVGAGELGVEHLGGSADLGAGDARGADHGDVSADPGLEGAEGGGDDAVGAERGDVRVCQIVDLLGDVIPLVVASAGERAFVDVGLMEQLGVVRVARVGFQAAGNAQRHVDHLVLQSGFIDGDTSGRRALDLDELTDEVDGAVDVADPG